MIEFGANLSNPTCSIIIESLPGDVAGQFTPNSILLYSGGVIALDTGFGNDPTTDMEILTHEIGHLVSLHHPHESNPQCCDDAVMQYDPNLVKPFVTAHDRAALIKKWGN